MPLGSVEYVVKCVPVGSTGNSTAPCDTINGVRYAPQMMQAYVIDPASQGYLDALAVPFDYIEAGAIWSFFFTFVVGLWLVAKNVGLIIEAIRKF